MSWLGGKETFDSKGQRVTRFYFNAQGRVCYEKERGTVHPKTVLPLEIGSTKKGSSELIQLLGAKLLEYPKPTALLEYLIKNICTSDNDIILDFFAGSSTTAHAVMALNAE
ncbi:DNA methyltransferase, partial [Bartonella sp. MU70NMGDW]|uniref:DNA methyltransferase n=1 Tax=Bartonella sp. MU70NMGDW TaxID=3243561 RepID=UPI0035D010B3